MKRVIAACISDIAPRDAYVATSSVIKQWLLLHHEWLLRDIEWLFLGKPLCCDIVMYSKQKPRSGAIMLYQAVRQLSNDIVMYIALGRQIMMNCLLET